MVQRPRGVLESMGLPHGVACLRLSKVAHCPEAITERTSAQTPILTETFILGINS